MFFSCHKLFLCLYRSFSACQSYISGSVPESVILPLYKNAFKVRLGQDIAVKMDIAGYCRIVLWQFVASLDGIKTTQKNASLWSHELCKGCIWAAIRHNDTQCRWPSFGFVSRWCPLNTDSTAFSASQQIEGDIETNGHLALSEQARNSWVMQLPYNSRSCGSDYHEH